MLRRAGSVVLLVLTGCRGGAGSEDPEEDAPVRADPDHGEVPAREDRRPSSASAVEPSPAPAATPAPTVAPERPAEPQPPVEPKPPVEPAPRFDARITAAGLPVGVRIDEQPPASEDAPPTLSLIVSIDGATQGDRLLALPTGFEWCERSEAVVEPVAGQPSPLVLAQAFCESGEDEFSRDILIAVVHVGDAATAPRVLWQGKGSFSSSFGVCQRLDVPLAEVPRAGTLLIEQLTEVVFDRDPDLPEIRCRPKKARTRTLAELAF